MNIQDITTEELVAELSRRREAEINSIKASPLAFQIMDAYNEYKIELRNHKIEQVIDEPKQ